MQLIFMLLMIGFFIAVLCALVGGVIAIFGLPLGLVILFFMMASG